MLKKICSFFVFLLIAQVGHSQDETGETPSGPARTITMVKVTDQIYMFKGKGGNIGVQVGEDGVLMVDNQFSETSPEIVGLIQSLSDHPVQFIVNTHHHGDHTGGNKNFNAKGVVIFSHDNVRKRLVNIALKKMNEEADAAFKKQLDELKASGNTEKAEEKAKERVKEQLAFVPPQDNLPMVTFSDDMTFYYNGEQIMVFHVHNAHTDGDSIVYFMDSNVLHTGDVFFNGRYPYIDTNNGGDYKGYIDALGRILSVIDEDTKIIPGHGELASKSDLYATHKMMKALLDRVTFQYASFKSKEEVVKMKDLSAEYDEAGYGDGFINTERFLGLIYDYAKKKYGKLERKK